MEIQIGSRVNVMVFRGGRQPLIWKEGHMTEFTDGTFHPKSATHVVSKIEDEMATLDNLKCPDYSLHLPVSYIDAELAKH